MGQRAALSTSGPGHKRPQRPPEKPVSAKRELLGPWPPSLPLLQQLDHCPSLASCLQRSQMNVLTKITLTLPPVGTRFPESPQKARRR